MTEVAYTLMLEEHEIAELDRLARGAGFSQNQIVEGIIQLYLAGKVKKPTPVLDAKTKKFVDQIARAVRLYNPTGFKPNGVSQGMMRAKANGVRIGRPPVLSEERKRVAREMKGRGMTYAGIGQALGVNPSVIRRACAQP